jgi:hypothetical protein
MLVAPSECGRSFETTDSDGSSGHRFVHIGLSRGFGYPQIRLPTHMFGFTGFRVVRKEGPVGQPAREYGGVLDDAELGRSALDDYRVVDARR